MNDLVANTLESARAYAPKLLAALAILVVGWIVAAIVARVVRVGLNKISVDSRIGRLMSQGDEEKKVAAAGIASRGLYFFIMLFTLVAAFQALGLTLITEPLNAMINQVMVYLPKILGAALLLVVAWIVATVVRTGVGGLLRATSLDAKFGETLPSENAEQAESRNVPVSQSLADAGYWLVFLLFLPAVISALGLEGLLGPAQNLVGQILGFLPNLLAASLIFVVGWFVARIIQKVVTNLLGAAGADRLADRVGISASLGQQGLSGVIGTVLYALVLIPVLIASLNALKIDALTEPASAMLNTMLAVLPQVLAAMMVLAVAFVLGRVVSNLATNVLSGVGFDNVLPKLGLQSREGAAQPSQVVGTLVLVAILFFATIEALNLIGLNAVAALGEELLVFAGHVALGVVILGAGLFVANFAAQMVRDSGARNANLMSTVARIAIMVLTTAMALRQMGLASDIINLAFGLLLGAVAIATAVAFGIGGRHHAEKALARWNPPGGDSLRSKQAEG